MDCRNKYYMFFWNLPISLEILKDDMNLCTNIFISKKTQTVIQYLKSLDCIKNNHEILNAIYPHYGITGLGCHHRIIYAKLDNKLGIRNQSDRAYREIWQFLGILRLVKPFYINIAGGVTVYENEVENFSTILKKSYLNVPKIEMNEYNKDNIKIAGTIYESLFGNSHQESRILSAVRSYIKLSLTEGVTFQDTFF